MTMIEATAVGARIDGAVVRNTALSSTGILERVFSAAFRWPRLSTPSQLRHHHLPSEPSSQLTRS